MTRKASHSSRLASGQRGAASLGVVLILLLMLTAAVLAVTQFSGSAIDDAVTNDDQVAALFLAESGLQRAQALINPDTPSTACVGSGTSGAISLGRGTFSVTSSVEQVTSPLPCSTTTPCYSCVLSSTGTVNGTTRIISQRIGIGTIRGAGSGVGASTDIIKVVNPYSYPVLAVFSVGISQTGTATKAYTCKYGASNPPTTTCPAGWEEWFSVSNVQSNNPGANNYGATVPLASNQTLYLQFGFQGNDVYAITGGLFRCASTDGTNCSGTDNIKGYWKDNIDPPPAGTNNILTVADGSQSGYASTYYGRTNSGVANTAVACQAPTTNMNFSSLDSSHNPQVCTNWCTGADTLVFGVAPIMNANIDTYSSITSITFGTDSAGGYPAQNVPLGHVISTGPISGFGPDSSPLASFPPSNANGVIGSTSVYSQMWYAYNPNLSPASDVSGTNFNPGEFYRIVSGTGFTSIGASSNTAGVIFQATGAGASGTGTATHLPFAYNVSSYKGNGVGAIGAKWTGSGNTVAVTASSGWTGSFSGTTLTVSGAAATIYPGALITRNGTGTRTVVAQLTSTEPGNAPNGRGTYTLSAGTDPGASGTWTATNAVLTVGSFTPQAVTAGSFVPNVLYKIASVGSTDFTLIGAASNTVGVVFAATNVGAGNGTATPVGFPYQVISAGDTVSSAGGSGSNITNATVVSQLTSNESGSNGGRGTYSLTATGVSAVTDVAGRTWTSASSILNVGDCKICFIESNDPVSGLVANKSISSQIDGTTGGIGRYTLSSSGAPSLPTTIASSNSLKVGTPGTTLYLPAAPAPSLPVVPAVVDTVDNPLTRISVYANPASPVILANSLTNANNNTLYEIRSVGTTNFTSIGAASNTVGTTFRKTGNNGAGTGTVTPAGILAAGSLATAVSAAGTPNAATRSITVSAAPVVPLDLATVCGGTCAFFNNPFSGATVSTTTGTQFSLVHSGATNVIKEYAGGFTCLTNVTPSSILPFTQFTIIPGSWTEVVR